MRTVLAMLLLAGPAMAEDWARLDGPGITAALTARVLGYEGGATQNFYADGRTLYESGGSPSWGTWRVEGDRYCSRWPPRDAWDCYAVEAEARGLDLRFVGEGGAVTTGRYQDLR
jgi:hypothetical protein